MVQTCALFFNTHRRTFFGIVFGLAFSAAITYAVPPSTQYTPGATLDPTCAPGDTNCTVLVDVSSAYTGQSSITTLGTITSGVWNGTAIANANLAHSSVTIGSTTMDLGTTTTTLAGLTSVTSTTFVGALTGTASGNELPLTFSAPLSRTGNTVSVPAATTSVDGYLSSTDWNTFNNKGSGSVTSISVPTANGFFGTVTNGTTTPSLALELRGTTESDISPNVEQLTSAGWTSTDWTGSFGAGFTHTAGNTTTLTNTTVFTAGVYYKVTLTVTGRTAGSISTDIGGVNYDSNTSANYTFNVLPTVTGTLAIIPTSDFNGTVVVSIVTNSTPSLVFKNSTGTTGLEMRSSSDKTNIFLGTFAGASNTTGSENVFIGHRVGGANTVGGASTGVGAWALASLTGAGIQNTAFGYYALSSLRSANFENVAVGGGALYSLQSGNGANTAIGNSVLYLSLTGQYNTGVGYQALRNSTGNENTALGMSTLYGLTIGNQNVGVGRLSGFNTTTGSNNTYIGYQAGRTITIGGTNTFIGNNAGFNGSQLVSADNSIAIGASSYTTASNQMVLGASTITSIGLGMVPATTVKLDVSDTTLAGSGALAGTLLNLAQTWNTSGTPTAIKLNVTNTASGATAGLIDLQIGAASRFRVDKFANVTIGSSDLTNGLAGPVLTIGRNTNVTNTGAGSVNFLSKAGTNGYVWQDAAGNLRINTLAPASANDTAGTVVGAQTSTRETKQDIKDYTDYGKAFSLILNAPLHTFRYIREVEGYGTDSPLAKTRIGYIADEVDPQFMAGNAIDQVSVNGLLMASIKEIDFKIIGINDLTAPNTWREALIAWFASAGNGIGELFATKIHTETICVKKSDGSDICLNGDQLQGMVQGSGTTLTTTPTTPTPTSEPVVTPTVVVPEVPVVESPAETTSTPVEEVPPTTPVEPVQ